MKSSLNQWNQQRYYRDAEGSKMVKHNPFQLIIEKRESQWIIPTPFSRILQAMKEWIIGWVGISMGESKTIVFWKVKQWCWLDGVTNRRESVLRPFVCRNRFTKQSLFMDWPRFSHSFDGIWTPMLINESKMEEWDPKGSSYGTRIPKVTQTKRSNTISGLSR